MTAIETDLAPNARIPCSSCGRPCRSHLTRLCRTCLLQLPRNQRPSLRPGWYHPTQQTGTNRTVNAAPPDDLQNGSDRIRPGSKFENTQAEKAAARRLVAKKVSDPAERTLLERMLGIGKDR